MLYTSAIRPETLGLLKKLMSLTELEGFSLAGGTALALQIGHRLSVDLDFFSDVTFHTAELIDAIKDFAEIRIF